MKEAIWRAGEGKTIIYEKQLHNYQSFNMGSSESVHFFKFYRNA